MPPTASARTGGAATASDRRQSTRTGRATGRPSNYYARNFPGRFAANGLEQTPEAANNTPGFLPAITHFTQAVDAFPKELIKHFSMFKEVEAKMHDPENVLKLLLNDIAAQPVTTQARQRTAAHNSAEGDVSTNASINGASMQDPSAPYQQLFPADYTNLPPDEQADLKNRQLFFRLRMLIAQMLPILDEKLVVLGGAKTTKDKGLARMKNSYAHLDDEISEEARYGSLTHWAYADKEEKKKGPASHERQRREVVAANNLAAAAQHVHDADSIAAKSEARREAMLANKRSRHQQIDSDFDDRPVKKPHKRKALATDTTSTDARNVGLGISNNGAAPQGKRKKTEKALAGAAPPMERSLSGAMKSAAGAGGRSGTSPRGTPGAESGGPGKRKPRAAPAPAPRKHPLPPNSPPLASSPLAANFAPSKPSTANVERSASSRARKNSTATSVASAAPDPAARRPSRPSSSHSVKQPTSSNAITELEQAAGVGRDDNSVQRVSSPKEQTEVAPPVEASALKQEEAELVEGEGSASVSAARGGRASKTATPVAGTFPEIPMARSRSTRNANNSNSNASSENNSTTTGPVSKRGHKKSAQSVNNASLASPAQKPTANAKSNPPSSASSVIPEQEFRAPEPEPEGEADTEDDGDEPRYCYCNEVSYGNMIACDNNNCPREWFHLGCVSLEKVPTARTKWFCSDECKEAYTKEVKSRPAKGGRPGSSRQ